LQYNSREENHFLEGSAFNGASSDEYAEVTDYFLPKSVLADRRGSSTFIKTAKSRGLTPYTSHFPDRTSTRHYEMHQLLNSPVAKIEQNQNVTELDSGFRDAASEKSGKMQSKGKGIHRGDDVDLDAETSKQKRRSKRRLTALFSRHSKNADDI
jgi:hypothetical protein